MFVHIHDDFKDHPAAQEAAALTGACVHCGFCLATCPTYLDNRDERDSPRGRIYLIKSLLETASGAHAVETHLDRCLTCRSCETTCPSGVEYARIADAGRSLVADRDGRSPLQRSMRWLLRQVVPRPALFTSLLRIGQSLRGAMPARPASARTTAAAETAGDAPQPAATHGTAGGLRAARRHAPHQRRGTAGIR